jgi:outer membrane protein
MHIKTIAALAGVLAITGGLAGPAEAADAAAAEGFKAGDILVRLRGVYVDPEVSTNSSTIGGKVRASDSLTPEIDGTYFFTPHIAVEAIGAVTRHHMALNGSTAGNVDLGRVELLPPTVTAQYHFLPTSTVNPYLGAGVNYTWFFGVKEAPGSAANIVRYDNNFGEVLQAGADFHLCGNWYANVDVKQVFLSTVAHVNHSAIMADVNLNPTLVGVGVGYKF